MAPEGSPIIYRNMLHFVQEYQPEAWSLRGAQMIEPMSQGDYDGLCGLYCIINAFRLVAAPYEELSHDTAKALFKAGVMFLARRGRLSSAVHSAVGEGTWPALAHHMPKEARRLGLHLVLEQPLRQNTTSSNGVTRAIERLITSGKAPMVFMRGKYRHYSVISGYTPTSFKLFDSFGYHWVRRSSCSVDPATVSLHRFHVPSMIAVSAT